MTDLALRLRGVSKRYGEKRALDGLNLEVPRGSICGLIGPNGAGKTTCFGVVGGFVRPDSGEVDILGMGPFRVPVHGGRLALVPQDAEWSPHTSVDKLLRHFARLQGQSRAEAERSADRALELVELRDARTAKIRQLSHGMRRRVAVAQALLGDPELVLLDEPTSGLDPHLVVHMRRLFASFRGQRTLVLSSHNLADLEAVCDHLVFMEAGRCTRQGRLTELTAQGTQIRIRCEGALPDAARLEAQLPGVRALCTAESITLYAPEGVAVADLNARAFPALLSLGVRILEVRAGESLEEAYMKTRPR